MKNLEKFTDHELINHTLSGDSAAYGEIYNRYYQRVYHKCVSIVKDDELAFDLAEEAILKALNNLKSFRGDAAFATWLYIIVHRHCLEFLRKESKHTRAVTSIKHEQLMTIADETSDDNEWTDQMEQIMMSLIERLPENEKQLLMLKYAKGESIEALQKMFHLSASAIKMRLKRTKEHLQQLYLIATTSDMQHGLAFV
jgi:RNA polymerase sigma-70 factor (ECF subfamily)